MKGIGTCREYLEVMSSKHPLVQESNRLKHDMKDEHEWCLEYPAPWNDEAAKTANRGELARRDVRSTFAMLVLKLKLKPQIRSFRSSRKDNKCQARYITAIHCCKQASSPSVIHHGIFEDRSHMDVTHNRCDILVD